MKHDNDLPTTDTTEIKQLIDRVKQGKLDPGDAQLIEKLLGFLLNLITLLQGNTTMKRLKKLLFGLKKRMSNKSQADKNDEKEKPSPGAEQPAGDGTSKESASTGACEGEAATKPAKKAKKTGHGRRPASDYTGAKIVRLDHPDLSTGDRCPEPGCEGHLHRLKDPKVTIYLTGQPVINATKYERPLLRCSDCFTRYVAELPPEVKKDDKDEKPEKYDDTADVAIALYKYGGGVPFYRQEKLQESCGVPLPASVQFERCERVANVCYPVYRHLIELAANAKIHYIDGGYARGDFHARRLTARTRFTTGETPIPYHLPF